MAASTKYSVVREILLCLLGHGGDVFAEVKTDGDWDVPRFAVNRDATEAGLDPGGQAVVEYVLPVASNVHALSAFCTRHDSAVDAPSLYVHALADGVDVEVSAVRKVVVDVDHRLRADATLPLSAVRHAVLPFAPLLQRLVVVCGRVEADNLRGGQLLSVLVEEAAAGAARQRAAFRRLLFRCQQVLFHQTIAWTVYGTLRDATKEFFVAGGADGDDGDNGDDGDDGDDLLGDGPADTDEEDAADLPADTDVDPVVAEREWLHRYSVRTDMVAPNLVPVPVAESVVFVGKAVRLFTRVGSEPLLDAADEADFLAQLSTLRDTHAVTALHVECAVDRIRGRVATLLWQRLVLGAQLTRHLQALNDYFLMARGELFQAYLDNVRRGVHDPYAAATDVLGAAKDPLFPLFTLFEAAREFEYPAKPASDPPLWLVHDKAKPWWHPHPVVVAEGFTTSFVCVVARPPPAATGPSPPGLPPAAASVVAAARRVSSGSLLSLLAADDAAAEDSDDDAAPTARGFSLVLHTEGPAARGDAPSRFGRHDAVGGCLVVRFRLLAGYARAAVLVGRRRPGSGCVLQDRSVLAAGDRKLPLQADGTLAVTVEYTRPAAGAARGLLTVSASPSFRAGQAAAPPALALDINLRDAFPLRGVRGRAWAGFATAPPPRSSRAGTARLRRWHWLSTSRADDGEGGVGMHYRVPWPLHLVLTQASLDHYNELFRFVLRLRRVASALHDCWTVLMASRGSPLWAALQPVWLLRSRMAFVVNNLQYYHRQDVVEPAAARLMDTVVTSKDFWAVKHAHDAFIHQVVQRSFLLKPAVSKAVSEVLVECAAFAALVTRNADCLHRCIGEDKGVVQRVERAFHNNANFLFDTQRASRFAAGSSLMLRMDFNGFFKKDSLVGGGGLSS